MSALFADTFYWIALADPTDSAHSRALVLTDERATSRLVTTDEVLTEYLAFFAASPHPLRRAKRRKALSGCSRAPSFDENSPEPRNLC